MKRTSGILLHFTSLPTKYGIGDLGPQAVRFGEFLASAGQRHWQVLPVGPTATFIGNSPYSSFSAFGASTLLISPEALYIQEMITKKELQDAQLPTAGQVNYTAVTKTKDRLLRSLFEREKTSLLNNKEFVTFLIQNGHWLNDLALFMAAKEHLGGKPWFEWPEGLRARHDDTLATVGNDLAEPILYHKYCQYLFFTQLADLKKRLTALNITLIGDAPIYVTHDSPDVWCNKRLFKLDENDMPTKVAGVPPDYFSETGQRWGNPVFDWKANQADGFGWWISRLRHNFGLFDQVRLDHFRGFTAYWEVDAKEETAMHGQWAAAAGAELLEATLHAHGSLPIIAEDLGIITQDVVDLRKRFGLPGMRVLQFAFSENLPADVHAPHLHEADSVVYAGTHDNDTTRGWLSNEMDNPSKARLARYTGRTPSDTNVAWTMIELAMKSVACQCILTAQDLLELPGTARMNTPGEKDGNWTWRMTPEMLEDRLMGAIADKLGELTAFYGREETEVLYDELKQPPAKD